MKSRIYKIFKIALATALFLLLFIAVYLAAAFGLSRLATEKEEFAQGEVDIYILTNGVHTDIVMPVMNQYYDWRKDIRFEHTLSKDTTFQYLAVGWGDKGFYLETPTWADLKFSTAFRAAFSLSSAAIHATFYNQMKLGDDCMKIQISKQQYMRLVSYVKNSLITDEAGKTIWINTNAVYGRTDAFYEARGRYNLFHTCNTWANNALKSCGQKACYWTIFDTGIFNLYKQPILKK